MPAIGARTTAGSTASAPSFSGGRAAVDVGSSVLVTTPRVGGGHRGTPPADPVGPSGRLGDALRSGHDQAGRVKAVVHDRYGPPDVLRVEDVPVPTPASGQVRVRVAATSVNLSDW